MDQPLKVYGALWCPDCRRTLRFLKERQIQFDFVDLEEHPEEKAVVRRRNAGMEVIPTLIFGDGTFLAEPSNEALARKLGVE
ncbi:MAG: glutaredoxin domain-containing protein [Dehalococcoidia bacterium]|jgi:thioredoxin reductase (NADPH)